MLRRSCFIALALFLGLLSALPSRADEVTEAMRKADARLQTRVTLRSPHILIGELLERLSRQSGVILTADADSATGGDSVAVSLRDVPLADAMDAVWSLFSYRHAEWDWHRSAIQGAEGKYAYNLVRPDYARSLAERLKKQVQVDFEAQAQELLNALDMPPDQLKEAAKHDFLLNSMVIDGRVGPGMRVLADLPPGTLRNLLRGGPPISMPVSQLPPSSQKALQEARTWQAAAFARDHIPEADIKRGLGPEPTRIGIVVNRSPDLVAPALYIDSGQGSGQYFGGNYMEAVWRQKMNADWMQPKENADDPASARVLAASEQPPGTDAQYPLGDYLLRSSDAAHVPLIARIPQGLGAGTQQQVVAQLPVAKTVQAFLEGAGKQQVNLQHKWRGGVLLLACHSWFVSEDEAGRLPWAEVRRLRDAEAAGDGFLSFDELAHAAAVLNVAQMHSLAEWFPVMDNAAQWHDFLAYYDKTPEYRPRVLAAKGDDFQYPESLVSPPLSVSALRAAYPNLRLRVRQKSNTERNTPTREVYIELLDDAGIHAISGQGFGYTAHEYQTRLKVDEGALAVGKKVGVAK